MNDTQEFGLDQVNVTFLEDDRTSTKAIPLIISPRWNDSLDFLVQWININQTWVDEQILKYGAVLIRGFEIQTPVDFEKATLAVQPGLCDFYRGTSPRTLMPGTKYAFSAADVPVNYPIAQHLEMSFLKSPPRHLYFGCMKASTLPGGETALCDFRKVYQDLSPELRNKLATKKLKYTRTHFSVGEKYTYDVGAMLSWSKLYGTSDKKEVEKIVREEGAPAIRWTGSNNDTYVQEWQDEPFQRHPETGEMVWFNHSQVFHWTTFPMELWFAFCRFRDFHLLIHFIFISIYSIIKYGLLGYKMALNTSFGDGTPITFSEMNEIRGCIHKNMVFSRWKKGDILCIDNFSTSHGRQPTYDNGRKVIVAWSQPHDKTQPIKTSSPAVSMETVTVPTKKMLDAIDDTTPDVVTVTPNASNESTLTVAEAQELKESLLTNRFEEQMANAFMKHRASKRQTKRLSSCPDLLNDNSDFWKTAAVE